MADFDLDRFVTAQEGMYDAALFELHAGKKRTHWMWFIFPQITGLGRSSMAQQYGIGSLEEAKAYLAHPVLGDRLRTATQAVLDSGAPSLHDLFGSPDDMKFRSCMTLFAQAADEFPNVFETALSSWCDGD